MFGSGTDSALQTGLDDVDVHGFNRVARFGRLDPELVEATPRLRIRNVVETLVKKLPAQQRDVHVVGHRLRRRQKNESHLDITLPCQRPPVGPRHREDVGEVLQRSVDVVERVLRAAVDVDAHANARALLELRLEERLQRRPGERVRLVERERDPLDEHVLGDIVLQRGHDGRRVHRRGAELHVDVADERNARHACDEAVRHPRRVKRKVPNLVVARDHSCGPFEER